jgi:hypothetical protein
LNTQKENEMQQYEFVFNNLKGLQFYDIKRIQIEGYIYPAIPFLFNEVTVTPSQNGKFSIPFEVTNVVQKVEVTAFDQTRVYTISGVSFYDDLKDHWIEDTALKLQMLNLIPVTSNFLPAGLVSAEMFSEITRPFWLPMDVTQNFNIADDERLTKAEAVSLIVNYNQLTDLNSKLPYWDVPPSFWAYNEISTAYAFQLIAKNARFYPDTPITKAELIAILSKLPSVKEKLTLFYD